MLFKTKKKKLITIPFDFGGFRSGDQVELGEFWAAMSAYENNLLDRIDRLECEIDSLTTENNDLQEALDEALPRRHDPYRERGVTRSDFEGGSCYA